MLTTDTSLCNHSEGLDVTWHELKVVFNKNRDWFQMHSGHMRI